MPVLESARLLIRDAEAHGQEVAERAGRKLHALDGAVRVPVDVRPGLGVPRERDGGRPRGNRARAQPRPAAKSGKAASRTRR